MQLLSVSECVGLPHRPPWSLSRLVCGPFYPHQFEAGKDIISSTPWQPRPVPSHLLGGCPSVGMAQGLGRCGCWPLAAWIPRVPHLPAASGASLLLLLLAFHISHSHSWARLLGLKSSFRTGKHAFASYLDFVCLSFPICSMGIIKARMSWCCEGEVHRYL